MRASTGRQKVSDESALQRPVIHHQSSSPPAEASQEAPVGSPLINDLTDASLQDYVFWLCHLFVIAAAGLLWLDHELVF